MFINLKAALSDLLCLAEKLVRAPSDAASEVARAVSATERAICEELRLGRVSVASSGLGSQEEVDPEYQCPICLVSHCNPPCNRIISTTAAHEDEREQNAVEEGKEPVSRPSAAVLSRDRRRLLVGDSQVRISKRYSLHAGGNVPAFGAGVRPPLLR